MNRKVEIFNHGQFGKIRTIYNHDNDDIWFVARDLSKMLGYKSLERMYDHVDGEDKIEINPQSQSYQGSCDNGSTLEPNPNIFRMMLINESGLYSAIFGSQLPQAKEFKRWVTSEVLPSIRKHGAYMTDQTIDEIADNPDLLIKLATNLKEEREKRRKVEHERKVLDEKVQLQAPKVEAWERLMDSGKSSDFAQVSKAFNIKGLGRNKFMKLLRDRGILRPNNEPYQQYVDSGYFEVILINNAYSPTKTLVTTRGIEWIMTKLKEWNYLV